MQFVFDLLRFAVTSGFSFFARCGEVSSKYLFVDPVFVKSEVIFHIFFLIMSGPPEAPVVEGFVGEQTEPTLPPVGPASGTAEGAATGGQAGGGETPPLASTPYGNGEVLPQPLPSPSRLVGHCARR